MRSSIKPSRPKSQAARKPQGRRRSPPTTPADIRRLRKESFAAMYGKERNEILTLARDRHGDRLPDDRNGRAMVKAMVAVEEELITVQRFAPWMTKRELEEIIEVVDAVPRSHWTGERLGRLVKLKDEERERLPIRMLHPSDVTWAFIQERVSRRKQYRDRERRRRSKEKEKMEMQTLGATEWRKKSLVKLFEALGEELELTAALIAIRLEGAWRRPDGVKLRGKSLEAVVRRTMNLLIADDVLAVRKKRHAHGFVMRFVRLKARKNDANTQHANVAPSERAGKADEMGVSGTNATPKSAVESRSPHRLSVVERHSENGEPPKPKTIH